jgi:hypothetical protein
MVRKSIFAAAILLFPVALLRAQAPPEERIPVTDPKELVRYGFSPTEKNVFLWSGAEIGRKQALETLRQALPKTFGTKAGYSTVMGYELQDENPSSDSFHFLGATYCVDLGVPEWRGHVRVEVPDGSDLAQFEFWAYDTEASRDVQAYLYEYCETPSLDEPVTTLIGSLETVGAIGRFYNFTPLNGYHVNNRSCSYNVRVILAGPNEACTGSTLQIQKLAISWVRQVSPAPATATFGDVPTSHPFFRFVEALNASGITGGCGGGNYCPDSPVTRGQMAVFLAKALGLSWP